MNGKKVQFLLAMMAEAGLQLEPEDTPKYERELKDDADKIKRDETEYVQLMAAFERPLTCFINHS